MKRYFPQLHTPHMGRVVACHVIKMTTVEANTDFVAPVKVTATILRFGLKIVQM
jgi:hypothetical protein